ncbi:MAG: hypothetical protein AAF607_16010 [Pseudomonadota bacterium]
MMRNLAGLVFALVIASCASDPRNNKQMTFDDAIAFQNRATAKVLAAQQTIRSLSNDQVAARLKAQLTDVTAIIKQTGHGIYVEYTGPDGALFMWYPGNSGVVAGTWGIDQSYAPPRACFKYFAARHGVTGEFEPNECVPPSQTLSAANVIEKRAGDVYQLRTKGIPYVKTAGNLPPWPEEWSD